MERKATPDPKAQKESRKRMFVLSNAWSTVLRHKWRSLIALLAACMVMFGGVFAQAVHAAYSKAHGKTYELLQPIAVIRPTEATLAKRNDADPAIVGKNLDLQEYGMIAQASQANNPQSQPQYAMSASLPLRQAKSGVNSAAKAIPGKSDQSADKTGGEFTLYGLFNADAESVNIPGRFKVTQGKKLKYPTQDMQGAQTKGTDGKSVLVSEALAEKNGLKVGSSFTIADPDDAAKTYKFEVCGIYTYIDPAPTGMGSDAKLAKNNRDNAIYGTGNVMSTNEAWQTSTSGWSTLKYDVGFITSSPDAYKTFQKTVKRLKLPQGYAVSSPTLEHYNDSLKGLDAFDRKMRIAQIALYAVCGVLLLALTAWGLTGRRDEIAADMVFGMTKARIGWQLALEALMPTVPGLLIGGVASIFASKPLGSKLTGGHATSLTSACWAPMWYCIAAVAALAIIAFLRGAFARYQTIFDADEGLES
ncbi:ABC transporter permease [Bifidobacterium bohemicum]|nr:ABC transporter permease [Bifidobacterium bohemicum]